MIGTPAYMSPEQAIGGDIGRSSDIYALGCLMYEMLTGKPPFTGARAQAILARQLGERPRSLRVVRPEIPLGVEQAVMSGLEKEPAKRPASAGLLGGLPLDTDASRG